MDYRKYRLFKVQTASDRQMKSLSLFFLSLVLFVAMALGHVPRKVTAIEDGGIGRVVNITTQTSNDSNAIEQSNLNIEVLGPDVVTIPENSLDDFGYVGIIITAINSGPTPVYLQFDKFIPELIGPDGKTIQGQINTKLKTRQSSCQLVYRGGNGVLSTSHVLRWEHNTLQLEIFNEDFGFWSFKNLKPGTYQLRFIYSSRTGLVSCHELEQKNTKAAQVTSINKGVTSFVPLRLVQPVFIDSNTVEVDGIRFELIMPERVLSIPVNQANVKTPVQLGMRITNNTSTPHRFTRFDTIYPIILGTDGKYIQNNGGRDGTIAPQASDCPLVMPQESVTFFMDANLFWTNNELRLGGSDHFGGIWYFSPLKPGTYYLGLGYANGGIIQSLFCPQAKGGRGRLEDFWIGGMNTKLLEVSLVVQ